MQNKTSKSVPGSACHANSHRRWRRAHGPRRDRGDARPARRLYNPMRQSGQTLTSSLTPALITCLRWRAFTSECAREGASRHDLLRQHRGSSSACPAPTTPAGVRTPQPSSGPAPVAYSSSSSTLDTPRSNSTRTFLAALVVHLVPARNATRRAALPPSYVPPHAGHHAPVAQRHVQSDARIERCPPRCRPLRRRAVSAAEEEGGSLRAGQAEGGLAASCFLHCVWETGDLGSLGGFRPAGRPCDTLGCLALK